MLLQFPKGGRARDHGRASADTVDRESLRAASRVKIAAVKPARRARRVLSIGSHQSAGMLSRWPHFGGSETPAPIAEARASGEGQRPMTSLKDLKRDSAIDSEIRHIVFNGNNETANDCELGLGLNCRVTKNSSGTEYLDDFLARVTRAREARARVAIYARFSTDKQHDRSIDDQVALCRDIAERAAYVVVGVYEDRAVSATSTHQRLGWQRLLRDAKRRNFDVVVAEDQDRIARDEEDWHAGWKWLNHYDVVVHTAAGVISKIESSVRAMLSAHQIESLRLHVRRGMAGAVKRSSHMGGRSYGYRTVKGEKGQLEIVPEEAAMVRQILEWYADGTAPRAIAIKLNEAGVPAPRGGVWSFSTILGSPKRGNGILNNALYNGQLIWNRQSFRKDPETHRRVSRENAAAEMITTEVPQYRIVAPELWARVQARRERKKHAPHRYQRRPSHLLSGLLKCGGCGGGYVVGGKTSKGERILYCSRMRDTGTCSNKLLIRMNDVERRVLGGVESQLAAPDVIATFIRAYNRRWKELQDSEHAERHALGRQLAEAEAKCRRVVNLLIEQLPTKTLRATLIEAEAERERLATLLAAVKPSKVEFHPKAADAYREKVRSLKASLATAQPYRRDQAFAAIREMVEKIVVWPAPEAGKYDLEIHGKLALLLLGSAGTEKTPESEDSGAMVAGVRPRHRPRLPALVVRIRSGD